MIDQLCQAQCCIFPPDIDHPSFFSNKRNRYLSMYLMQSMHRYVAANQLSRPYIRYGVACDASITMVSLYSHERSSMWWHILHQAVSWWHTWMNHKKVHPLGIINVCSMCNLLHGHDQLCIYSMSKLSNISRTTPLCIPFRLMGF